MALIKNLKRPKAPGVAHRVRHAVLLSSVFFVGTMAWAADSVGGIAEQPLAPRSGPRGATMFQVLSPQDTGVVTENNYADPKMWAERYHELEVGAVGTGVTIGDYDGDGRPDIFVVSKTESCRLFRNLGNWKFADVTEAAGVADHGDAAGIWKQGACFVDVGNGCEPHFQAFGGEVELLFQCGLGGARSGKRLQLNQYVEIGRRRTSDQGIVGGFELKVTGSAERLLAA